MSSLAARLTGRLITRTSTAVIVIVSLVFVACEDDGSSVVGLDLLVPHPDILGGSTECEDGYAWIEEQHVQHDSTELLSPAVCWEYPDSATVSVHIRYAFLTSGHDGWHTLRLFHRDHRCDAPLRGEGGFELLDSAWVEDPENRHSLSSDSVTVPASPGCAFVVVHESGDSVRGSSDNHAYVDFSPSWTRLRA